MTKSICLGISIVDLSKILIYDIWYDYVKPNEMKRQSCVLWTQTVPLYT